MKASELIEKLQAAQKKHGDCDVGIRKNLTCVDPANGERMDFHTYDPITSVWTIITDGIPIMFSLNHVSKEDEEVPADPPPKLTAEELERRGIEWPEGAFIAVVSENGCASFGIYYHNVSIASGFDEGFFGICNSKYKKIAKWTDIPGKWDASDWKNSLIRRPEKKETLPDWRKISSDTPPKLTAEELARRGVEWPEWANWCAMFPNSFIIFYEGKPAISENGWDNTSGGKFMAVFPRLKFDASDWPHSLIKKPENKLPDWCKVGALVYNTQFGYGTIFNPKNEVGIVVIDWINGNRGGALPYQVSEARIRPWTHEDGPLSMKLKYNGEFAVASLCTLAKNGWGYAIVQNGCLIHVTMEEISRNGIQLDGTPCGCLEHREGDGWVR